MNLRPLMDAGDQLAVRDRRTIEHRLGQLGVPVMRLGRRVYYEPAALERALRNRLGPRPPQWRGTVMPEGTRLWD